MTRDFSLICQIRDCGSGQILQPRQLSFAGTGKNCGTCPDPSGWWLVRRDSFPAKESGLLTADCATNVYYRNRRAVRIYVAAPFRGQIPYNMTVTEPGESTQMLT